MLQSVGLSVGIIELLTLGKNSAVISDCLADVHMPTGHYAISSLTTSSILLKSCKKLDISQKRLCSSKDLKKPYSN